MDRPIVSVIIPVYNAEKSIEKAVDSICSQTLIDWEMFLVDDGSTDRSGFMCDSMAEDDSRIQVIHQENQGPAAARNAALVKAKGKYLYFMDSDDWASSGMLYDMVCLAENYYLDAWAGTPVDNSGRRLASIGQMLKDPVNLTADVPESKCAQMVIAGYYIETYYSETEYYIQKQCAAPKVFADKSEFREQAHILFDRNLLYTPWNKLYLASFIKDNNISFPNIHWDDFTFNLDVVRNIQRVSVTDRAYYHFIRSRSDSESEKYNVTLYYEREAENQKLIALYEGWSLELKQQMEEELRQQQEKTKLLETKAAEEEKKTEEAPAEEEKPVEEVKPAEEEKPAKKKPGRKKKNADAEKAEVVKEPAEAEKDAEPEKTEAEITEESDAAETETAIIEQQKEELELPEEKVNIPSPEASEFLSRRYLERLIGCVENVTNPRCQLSKKEKVKEIKQMISQDSVKEALKTAKPKSLYLKAMMVPVRMRSARLTYMEGAVITRVKTKNMKLFARLKDNR